MGKLCFQKNYEVSSSAPAPISHGQIKTPAAHPAPYTFCAALPAVQIDAAAKRNTRLRQPPKKELALGFDPKDTSMYARGGDRQTGSECPLLLIHAHNILGYLFVSPVHVERRLSRPSLLTVTLIHPFSLSPPSLHLSSGSLRSPRLQSFTIRGQHHLLPGKKKKKKKQPVPLIFLFCPLQSFLMCV